MGTTYRQPELNDGGDAKPYVAFLVTAISMIVCAVVGGVIADKTTEGNFFREFDIALRVGSGLVSGAIVGAGFWMYRTRHRRGSFAGSVAAVLVAVGLASGLLIPLAEVIARALDQAEPELSDRELADAIEARSGLRLHCQGTIQTAIYATTIPLNRECTGPGLPRYTTLAVLVSGDSWCVPLPYKNLPPCGDAYVSTR